jgi:hypothetical protein
MLRLIFSTLPQMLLSGWAALLLLLAAVLVYLQYRRIASMETEWYGVAKHAPLWQTQNSLLMGILGGVFGSVVLSLSGVGLVDQPGAASALLYLWPLSIILGALNPRFFCFAYSSSLLSLSHLLTGWPKIDIPSVVGLVAVLHMVEALLIWVSGATCPTPMTIGGSQGEAVPGFMLQRFWPVPLVLPLFSLGAVAPVDMPAWWPLLSPGGGLSTSLGAFGWQLIPVVVTMGYSDLAIAAPPEQRARQSTLSLLAYSGILLLLAVAAGHYPPFLWVAALFSGVGHEAMAVWAGRVQLLGRPYLQRPARGVGVLDVLPGSPAEAGGLKCGAVIVTVDDAEVHTKEQLHEAMMAAPAYVRIMYRHGRQLGHCRLPRPVEGLFGFGAILLPEPGDQAVARVKRPGLFHWLGVER